jgi:hypothetical protein
LLYQYSIAGLVECIFGPKKAVERSKPSRLILAMAKAAPGEGSVLDTREFGLQFHGTGLNDYAEIEEESGSWTGDDGLTVDCEDGWSRSVSERGKLFGRNALAPPFQFCH